MIGRNHLLSTAAAWGLAAPNVLYDGTPIHLQGLYWGCALLGALLPDIDHKGSILGRRFKIISGPLSLLQGDTALLPWSEETHSRGITHSIWAVLVAIYFMNDSATWLFALSFGFLCHLVGDMLTPAGVRIFWPINYHFRLPITFTTGGVVEHLFTWCLVGGVVYFNYGDLQMLSDFFY